METQVYYGNHNLQKGIFQVSLGDWRSSSPSDLQLLTKAQGTGVSVVNSRVGAKSIVVEGVLQTDASSAANIEELLKQYDQIFNEKESRYLRSVPNYLEAVTTSSISDWAASDDATNLALNASKYQTGSSSVGFDIDVSASGNDYATLTYSSSTQVDLSSYTNTGNFELTINIPDVYYISSIDFRIGNDSSNYYGATLGSNYEGLPLENGNNVFSVAWTDTTETGTVNDAQIDYCYIRINYDSSAIDISSCFIDTIQWVDEDRVRNYPVFRDGEVRREGRHYNIQFTRFTMNLLNYVGYAIGTHSNSLFSANTTAITDTQTIELDGSASILPVFNMTINNSTEVSSYSIKNLTTGRQINFTPSNISDGDAIVFGGVDKQSTVNGQPLAFTGVIPDFQPGTGRAQLIVASTGADIVAQTIKNYTYSCGFTGSFAPTGSAGTYFSQTFQAGVTGTMTSLKVYAHFNISGGSAEMTIAIYTDSAGQPNTIVGSSHSAIVTGSAGEDVIVDFGDIGESLTSGTTYHIVGARNDNTYPSFLSTRFDESGNPYASGRARIKRSGSITYGDSFLIDSSSDLAFEFEITPAAAWDIDWSATYRKLYSA